MPYMRKTASQTGQYGRKGGRSVFVSNQSAGRSIGDSAYAIDGVNALASASVDAPEDPALNQQTKFRRSPQAATAKTVKERWKTRICYEQ
eukprot:COSAG06_NODE_617_length_13753_cov_134.082241_3_plen_90_part_00